MEDINRRLFPVSEESAPLSLSGVADIFPASFNGIIPAANPSKRTLPFLLFSSEGKAAALSLIVMGTRVIHHQPSAAGSNHRLCSMLPSSLHGVSIKALE